MKEKNIFMNKTIKLLTIILLYYIVGSKNLFLYVLSLSLYEVLTSFFHNLSFKERLDEISKNTIKSKIYKLTVIGISSISMLYLIISIIVSDIINILLGIHNILLVFIFMGISTIVSPLVKVTAQYYESINNNPKYQRIINIYYIFDNLLLLIIGLFVFRIFNVKDNLATSLLYLSKIISGGLMISFMHMVNKNKKILDDNSSKISYYHELKYVFTNNSHRKMVEVIKKCYYYMSIIILYLILSSRYGYKGNEIAKIITFVYFYALNIMEYLIYIVKFINKSLPTRLNPVNRIYSNFKIMISLVIFFAIISPITCKLLFYDASYAPYLAMINILAIFVLLYDITYETVKNKKVIYISLIIGIISKLILVIPLIDSFYRIGYNLVYGDIISTSIGMFLSIVVNYIYIVNTTHNTEKYFDKVLKILFDNIVFCIILVLIQFVIPMKTDNYFRTLGLLWLYLIFIFIILKIKSIKLKMKKRG